jgi:hypothetical protein
VAIAKNQEWVQAWISSNVGISVGTVYVFLTFYLPFKTPSLSAHPAFNIGLLMLIALTAGMVGWGFGIFLSPIGAQVKSATALASAFASFWTGVVVSHIESISRFLITAAHGETGQAAKVRLLFAGGIFLMSLFITVNSRFPDSDTDKEKSSKAASPQKVKRADIQPVDADPI